MNLRIHGDNCAYFNSLKRSECIAMEPRRIDAFAGRQIER